MDHKIISEMSWCNVLRSAGSDYCTNNFPGTFVDFHFKRFTQEIISSYDVPCRKIFNWKVSLKCPCQSSS